MSVRFPNRVGERGVYDGSAVTLTGSPARGMQTCASAVSAGALADGDMVGVSLVSVADPDRWAVWTAVYSSATDSLVLETVESVSTIPIIAGSAVDVTLCVTTQTLDWYVNGEPLTYFDGPDYWSTGSGVAWNSVDATYDLDGGESRVELTPAGGWAAGFRAASVSLEIFVPADASVADAEYTTAYIAAGDVGSATIGMGAQVGAWNAIVIDIPTTPGGGNDITLLEVSAGDPYTVGGLRFRHIAFTQ